MARHNRQSGTAVAERPRATSKRAPLRVSYPREGETISHPTYTVQIAVDEPAAGVEACVDQGDWQPCREALGLWWFDWKGYDSGEHQLAARLRRRDGSVAASEPRIVFVKLS